MTITLNVRTVNVILLMSIMTVVRVFLTNRVTKRCRRCRVIIIQFSGKTKKNTCGEKRAEI